MSGMCGGGEALLSIGALLVSPPEPWLLKRLLLLGAGVATVLVVVGLALCLRRRRHLRGYGAAIMAQAGFVIFLAVTNAYFLPSQ